jgi:hypothetical protein
MRVLMAHPPAPDSARQAAAAASSALSRATGIEFLFTCEAVPDTQPADLVHVWCGRDPRFSLLQTAAAAVESKALVATIAHLPFQPERFEALRHVVETAGAVCFLSAEEKGIAESQGIRIDSAGIAFLHTPLESGLPTSGPNEGRAVAASEPSDKEELRLLAEGARAAGLELVIVTEAAERLELPGAEAFASSPFGSSPEARALGAALAGAVVVCPDTAASRELLGPCGIFWKTDDGPAGLAEALGQRGNFERDVVRARLLSFCERRNPVRVLTALYREASRRGPARLSRGLLDALADYVLWLSQEAEAARGQAADLHRRLLRVSDLPVLKQWLSLKRLISRWRQS